MMTRVEAIDLANKSRVVLVNEPTAKRLFITRIGKAIEEWDRIAGAWITFRKRPRYILDIASLTVVDDRGLWFCDTASVAQSYPHVTMFAPYASIEEIEYHWLPRATHA